MSLCVAWRYESTFCLASDSCISLEADQRMCGIKVLQVPVRIISATDFKTRNYSIVYESVFGLTFAGKFLSGYLVKETISELLFNLQFVGEKEALNFEKICEVVLGAYRHIIDDLNGTDFGHDVDIIIIGKCPLSNASKAALFSRDAADGELNWKLILEDAPFSHYAIGGGDLRYYEVYKKQINVLHNAHFAVLNSIQEIAQSRKIDSVGGGLQYGAIEVGGEFQLFGTIDYIKSDDGRIDQVALFRGMDLNAIHEAEEFNDLYVHYDYATPFEEKRDRIFAETYPQTPAA